MWGVPVGELGLHHHAQLVGGGKGGLRRAVGVEPHDVDAVGLVHLQHLAPGLHRHGGMALLGELGAVGLPPQEESAAVEGQAALLGAKGAHAKADCLFIAATEGGDELVQVALVLVPAPDAGGQGQAPPAGTGARRAPGRWPAPPGRPGPGTPGTACPGRPGRRRLPPGRRGFPPRGRPAHCAGTPAPHPAGPSPPGRRSSWSASRRWRRRNRQWRREASRGSCCRR